MSAREAVLTACAELLGERPADESKVLADLGADSLDTLDMAMVVEEALGASLADEDINPLLTVANFIAVVERVHGKHSSVPA